MLIVFDFYPVSEMTDFVGVDGAEGVVSLPITIVMPSDNSSGVALITTLLTLMELPLELLTITVLELPLITTLLTVMELSLMELLTVMELPLELLTVMELPLITTLLTAAPDGAAPDGAVNSAGIAPHNNPVNSDGVAPDGVVNSAGVVPHNNPVNSDGVANSAGVAPHNNPVNSDGVVNSAGVAPHNNPVNSDGVANSAGVAPHNNPVNSDGVANSAGVAPDGVSPVPVLPDDDGDETNDCMDWVHADPNLPISQEEDISDNASATSATSTSKAWEKLPCELVQNPRHRQKVFDRKKKRVLELAEDVHKMCGAKVDVNIYSEKGRYFGYHSTKPKEVKSKKCQVGDTQLEPRQSTRCRNIEENNTPLSGHYLKGRPVHVPKGRRKQDHPVHVPKVRRKQNHQVHVPKGRRKQNHPVHVPKGRRKREHRHKGYLFRCQISKGYLANASANQSHPSCQVDVKFAK
ncbi:uncharacterized protein [Amphiura filiformis]|uniref:uncharacterized protein n=1 Tax=Amphiura filiformis TaxID=82378 RepID=UPI003B21EAE5